MEHHVWTWFLWPNVPESVGDAVLVPLVVRLEHPYDGIGELAHDSSRVAQPFDGLVHWSGEDSTDVGEGDVRIVCPGLVMQLSIHGRWRQVQTRMLAVRPQS